MSYTTKDLKEQLRRGDHAWPGGYPLYFVTADGAVLSFAAVREEIRQVLHAIRSNDVRGGWRVAACGVNYEDPALYCEHTHARIPSAYAEDEVNEQPLIY